MDQIQERKVTIGKRKAASRSAFWESEPLALYEVSDGRDVTKCAIGVEDN